MSIGIKLTLDKDFDSVDPVHGLWIGGDYIDPDNLVVGEIMVISPDIEVLIFNGLYTYKFEAAKTLEVYEVAHG